MATHLCSISRVMKPWKPNVPIDVNAYKVQYENKLPESIRQLAKLLLLRLAAHTKAHDLWKVTLVDVLDDLKLLLQCEHCEGTGTDGPPNPTPFGDTRKKCARCDGTGFRGKQDE